MTASYRRRNRLVARLAICAGGGLIAGGVLAIPFSGHDAKTAIVASADTAGSSNGGSSYGGSPGGGSSNGGSTTSLGAPVTTHVGAPVAPPQSATSAPTTTSATSATGATAASSPAATATTTAPAAPPPTATSPGGADPATSSTTASVATGGSTDTAPSIPGVDAAAYVLVDADSGATVAASNAAEHHPVGSMMKLLTAYVVMQAGDPTKVVTVPQLDLADDESRIYLSAGQHFQRDLLLRAMLIVSAGDAAEALAVDVAGSQDAFVQQMNAAARSLGMDETHAANADGLDADDGYSTADDIATLARVLMQDATFRATVVRTSAQLFGKSFPTTNGLLGSYPGATGIKTGHTTDAGYCLTASATRDGHSLIAVVIGTPTKAARDANAAALLDWGFAHAT